jgi:hypothetical protein
METLKERIEKFDAENGPEFVVDGNWLLLQSGAARELSPYGVLQRPPQDKVERAKKIVYFWSKKLELCIEEFNTHKNKMMRLARNNLQQRHCSYPNRDGLKVLKQLQSKVKAYQQKLQQAEAALEAAMPRELIDQQEMETEARQKTSQLISELEKIEV